MESLPTVLLKPGEADRIVAGHPWVYAGEILRVTAPVADGELVQVKDHRQRLIGTGFPPKRAPRPGREPKLRTIPERMLYAREHRKLPTVLSAATRSCVFWIPFRA